MGLPAEAHFCMRILLDQLSFLFLLMRLRLEETAPWGQTSTHRWQPTHFLPLSRGRRFSSRRMA